MKRTIFLGLIAATVSAFFCYTSYAAPDNDSYKNVRKVLNQYKDNEGIEVMHIGSFMMFMAAQTSGEEQFKWFDEMTIMMADCNNVPKNTVDELLSNLHKAFKPYPMIMEMREEQEKMSIYIKMKDENVISEMIMFGQDADMLSVMLIKGKIPKDRLFNVVKVESESDEDDKSDEVEESNEVGLQEVETVALPSANSSIQNAEDLYKRYSGEKGVNTIYVAPMMFDLIKTLPEIEINDENVQMAKFLKSFNGMYIIDIDSKPIEEKISEEFEEFIQSGDYEILSQSDKNNEFSTIYVQHKNDIIDEFVMLSKKADSVGKTSLIFISGEFSEKELLKIANNQ